MRAVRWRLSVAERALARLTRLLGIVSYLEAHGEAPFDELAARFGTTPTQIEADVWLLFTTGKPGGMPDDYVDFDGDALDEGIARLRDGQGLTQVRFSAREAVALLGALSSLEASGAAPPAAASALTKLKAAVGDVAPVEVMGESRADPQVVAVVREGAESGRAVALEYVDAQDHRTERLIEPHRLVTIDGVGYVECWCHRAGDYRTLRLDRIMSATLTEDVVTHAAADHTGFSLAPRYEATVEAARAARWALESMPGASISETDQGILTTFPVADADWVAGRLLAIGPHLHSVAPAALADAVARRAADVLAAQDG